MINRRAVLGSSWHPPFVALLLASALCVAARAQPAPGPELYFIAIGDVSGDLMSDLVSRVGTKLGVPVTALSPLGFDRATFDAQRSQVVADRLIQAVRYRYPSLAKNPRTRVIGITPLDMYMEAMREQWAFTFSLRSADQRFAVVSYARMDPARVGATSSDTVMRSRLRKMVIKNIGIIYFGLPVSQNPRSVLFGNILGVDDLDRMTEDFNPK